MKKPIFKNTGLLALLLLLPAPAWALQPHGSPEGIYVHQMAHLLFTGALLYLFWHTRRTPELKGHGWKFLQLFCVLFACWNMLAFIGHEVAKGLGPADFLNNSTWFGAINLPISPLKVLFFITKMDHLIYLPALGCLVAALRMFSKQVTEETYGTGRKK